MPHKNGCENNTCINCSANRAVVPGEITGKVVRIVNDGEGKYERTIADIYHDGTLINLALVKAGWAWHYVKSAPDDTALPEAEQHARERTNETADFGAAVTERFHRRTSGRISKDERDEFR